MHQQIKQILVNIPQRPAISLVYAKLIHISHLICHISYIFYIKHAARAQQENHRKLLQNYIQNTSQIHLKSDPNPSQGPSWKPLRKRVRFVASLAPQNGAKEAPEGPPKSLKIIKNQQMKVIKIHLKT